MATLSNQSYLMRKTSGGSSFEKLIDVTSIPTLKGTPETIDITTLSDLKFKFMNGLQTSDALEFGCWFDKDTFETLEAIERADKLKTGASQLDTYRVCIGTTEGALGIFEWQGKLTVSVTSYGVNEAIPGTVTISDEGDEALHWVSAA